MRGKSKQYFFHTKKQSLLKMINDSSVEKPATDCIENTNARKFMSLQKKKCVLCYGNNFIIGDIRLMNV
jgi:hypothetical protein